MSRWRSLTGVLALTLPVLCGCRVPDTILHLIPDGYVGPVVIVFGDPSGKPAAQDEDGATLYAIPPDGVLRLSTPAPEPGRHRIHYFYLRPDGLRDLPQNADRATLQVFASVDGRTEGGNAWRAYVVGVPGERDDWVRMRGEATSRATGMPGLP